MRLDHGRTEVAVADAVFQRDEALAVLAVDIGRPADELDLAEIAEPDIGGRRFRIGVRKCDRNRADGIDIPAEFRRQPHRQREDHLAFIDLGDFLTADRGLHHGIDVGDREAVARGLGAIDLDDEIGLAEQVEAGGVGDAADAGEFGLHGLGQPLQLIEVLAKNLDRVLALHAGNGFLDIVLDVLREVEIDADEFAVELLAQLLDHVFFGQPCRPGIGRLERNEELGEERAVGIGAFLAAALLGEYGLHRLIAHDDGADLGYRFHARFQRDRRRHHGADPHIAFFQLGQEFGAEPEAQAEAQRQKHRGDDSGAPIVADRGHQNGLVQVADVTDREGFDFLDMGRQQDRGQHRRHGEGGDDGAEQRVGIGPRHRPEDLAFDALHREQRQEGRDRDDHRKEDRLVDLDGAGQDPVQLVAEPRRAIGGHPRRVMGDVAEDVFHHDHGAVDDDAEVDGADRQQIGGLAPHHRDQDRQEQRHRNRGGDDQSAAQVTEEDPLDQKDQRDPEQQIVQHGLHRDRNQIAAVVERHDLDACRQRSVGVDLLHRNANALDHVHGAFELLHQHDAGDDVGLLVTAGDAESRCKTDADLGDIGYQHRNAALLGQYDIADIVERGDDADAADIDRLFADRDGTTADIGIIPRDRGHDLRQCQPIGHHAVEIDLGLKFLGLAAEHRDVGYSGHNAQLAFDHPVLQRLEPHHVHARRPHQLVAKDLADAAGGRDHRQHAGRQHRILQPVEGLLAHEMIVAAVFELQADETEAIDGVGANELQARRAGDRDLDRDRDVALDFLRRLALLLGDDLDDRRRRVGIRLDVQHQESGIAETEKGRERDHHQYPPRQAERDQTTQHRRPQIPYLTRFLDANR